ncbi:MAG: HAD-IA family hydrolase, partial [Flavobacterium sp.]|nr:HAD-IA family hydrolase [Pedobacter sp.]
TLLIGVPKVNHEILLEINKRYRSFLLSNNNAIHYEWILNYLQTEYKIPSNTVLFEKDYYSHLMKMRKPNANIFQFVLDENHLDPKETLFIDDSPQHIKAAAELGLTTHLLTLPETLESFIYTSGLLTRPV